MRRNYSRAVEDARRVECCNIRQVCFDCRSLIIKTHAQRYWEYHVAEWILCAQCWSRRAGRVEKEFKRSI
jgi:hypothetical protein